jgi:hypothetical protein
MPAALTRTAEDSAVSDQVAGQEPFEWGQYARLDPTDKLHQLAATMAGRIYRRLGA